MGSPRADFDLLLEAPTSVEADMARELLQRAGIPTYLHGRDRDLAELGAAIHNGLTRPDLFVPKGRRDEAEAVLKSAWDASALSDEVALSVPAEEPPPSRELSTRFWPIAVGAALILAVAVLYFIEYFSRRGEHVLR
jgi:hypothetical protein